MTRFTTLLIFLLLAGLSCGRKNECTSVSLTKSLPTAATLSETWLVDVGAPGQRQPLLEGWSGDERWNGQDTFVWGIGSASTLVVHRYGNSGVRLRFRCAPAPLSGVPHQTVNARINGISLPPVRLSAGFAVYELAIPAGAMRLGANVIEWRYASWGAPPNSPDTRPLAVAWDWIEFVEKGTTPRKQPTVAEGDAIFLPPRTGIVMTVPVRPGNVFVADRVDIVGQTRAMEHASVMVELIWDGGVSSARFDIHPGSGGVRVPISVKRPGTMDVRLLAPAAPAGGDQAAGWRIVGARLIQDGACR